MSREEWLARCAMAYDVGLVTDERLELMARWLEVVMQEGHSRLSDRHNAQHPTPNTLSLSSPAQWGKVKAFWNGKEGELERLERKSARMYHSTPKHGDTDTLATLANDVDGYALIQLAAIFTHPCQRCATDPGAWWTRHDCCRHMEQSEAAHPRPFSRPAYKHVYAVVASILGAVPKTHP